MDRRHRALLSWPVAVGALLIPSAANLSAQQAPPPVPAASATPWVQASLPPGLATPALSPTASPAQKPPDKPPKPPKPPHAPIPFPSPTATPSQEETTREMMRRREAEQHAQDLGVDRQEAKVEKKEARAEQAARVEQLPPDERAAYQRNLPLWRQLPEEERDALRKRADERARQEIDHAYQETGLNLDHDQREVFDLRYRQERRRLEHDLQEKANVERQRRLLEITAQLKQEFAARPTPGVSAAPIIPAAPKKAPSTPAATANPDALTMPGAGPTR